MKLSIFDISLIMIYFAGMVAIGFWYRRSSGRDMESYFLGGRNTRWWMLGLSGSVSNFDIAGTTWIVGMFFYFGFKAFNMFWAFAFLIGAFMMSYLAAWIRRTNAMTAAELIQVRFGDDPGSKLARAAAAVATSIFFLFAIGYGFVGVSKFLAATLDYDERMCATVLMLITGIYVLFGGFKGVILSDVIQAMLLNLCGIGVAVFAFLSVDVSVLHERIDPSPLPVWSMPEVTTSAPADYALYALFGPIFLLFLCRGLLGSMASPGGCYEEQRFLATSNPREAAVTGAAWSGFLVLRWAMAGAIAFVAITQIQTIDDPERVLSETVFNLIPTWMRGILVTGFLAAFMSTFSSTLNGVSSIIVRDLVQPYSRKLTDASLVRCSYLVTGLCAVIGIVIGWSAGSIQHIWLWMQLALMPSLLVPNILRWYWWRMTGWGYASGVLVGVVLASLQYFKEPLFGVLGLGNLHARWIESHAFDLYTFPVLAGCVFITCVIVSLATRPTERAHLLTFFRTVRPKGWWGPVRSQSNLGDDDYYAPNQLERPWRIVLNIILAKIAFLSLFMLPLYLIGHWFTYAAMCAAALVLSTAALYFTWYRRLETIASQVLATAPHELAGKNCSGRASS